MHPESTTTATPASAADSLFGGVRLKTRGECKNDSGSITRPRKPGPKAESAHLLLKLYEIRRDPVMREARDWFLRSFNPQSMQDVVTVATGPDNAKFRMVLGYWKMVAAIRE